METADLPKHVVGTSDLPKDLVGTLDLPKDLVGKDLVGTSDLPKDLVGTSDLPNDLVGTSNHSCPHEIPQLEVSLVHHKDRRYGTFAGPFEGQELRTDYSAAKS